MAERDHRHSWVREVPIPVDKEAIRKGGEVIATAVVAEHLERADTEGRSWVEFLAEAHGIQIKKSPAPGTKRKD
jgi:hypothetical protein